jgi:hypothetical protein
MIATQKTEPFAALPRWLTTVSDHARLDGRTPAIQSALSTGRCALRRAVTAFTSAGVPCDSNRSFKIQPPAAFKSP